MAEGQSVPDVFVDQMTITLNPYGALFLLGLSQPGQAGSTLSAEQVRVRMSLEHAKVLAMVTKRVLRTLEDQQGFQIRIPSGVLNAMGLSDEDW